MCGRYSLSPGESREIMDILRQVQGDFKTGEIFPADPVPVLMEAGEELAPEVMVWGYPGVGGKGRPYPKHPSATTRERAQLRHDRLGRRGGITPTGFYEWGPAGGQKRKYRFQLPGRDRALYLAGLWNDCGGQRRCVILTTAANPSMAGIHDRMPLVLEREQLAEWVHSPQAAGELLRRTPPALEHVEEEPPRQLSLF